MSFIGPAIGVLAVLALVKWHRARGGVIEPSPAKAWALLAVFLVLVWGTAAVLFVLDQR